jgi:hypothetical protein
MPSISERPAQPAQDPQRGDLTELQQRYRAIGISAVAAAMRFRNDPEPSDRDRKGDFNPRAA